MILLVPEVWIISGRYLFLEKKVGQGSKVLKRTKMMFRDGGRIFRKKNTMFFLEHGTELRIVGGHELAVLGFWAVRNLSEMLGRH